MIRFFYQRALQDKRTTAVSGNTSPALVRPQAQVVDQRDSLSGAINTAPGLDPVRPCETTYRYDGPRPQFKESAIIHLADAVEAASRSMRKVSPQHLGELIDQVFHERIEDGQLEEAPVTFEELSKIKTSFTFTLLNMLHSRVSYDAQETAPKAQPAG